MSMRRCATRWRRPDWGGGCCARIITCGALAGSCRRSAVSGTSKNCSAGRRRVAWRPGGPSHQWADGSIRLHTFATVLGLMLVSLAKIALGTGDSALAMMGDLAAIRATLVRTTTGGPGRRATVMIAPELTTSQRRAVKAFELDRWMPTLLSCMTTRPVRA